MKMPQFKKVIFFQFSLFFKFPLLARLNLLENKNVNSNIYILCVQVVVTLFMQ